MEEEQKKVPLFPILQPKPHSASTKSLQEAPYRALVGVLHQENRETPRHQHPRHGIRNQTGITNRWRLPQSLRGDMLGTSQAMKAVNVPFDQTLVTSLTRIYPIVNQMLLMCNDFPEINERNWSLLKKTKPSKPLTEEEEFEPSLPNI